VHLLSEFRQSPLTRGALTSALPKFRFVLGFLDFILYVGVVKQLRLISSAQKFVHAPSVSCTSFDLADS
jgi:hypothetical protein